MFIFEQFKKIRLKAMGDILSMAFLFLVDLLKTGISFDIKKER